MILQGNARKSLIFNTIYSCIGMHNVFLRYVAVIDSFYPPFFNPTISTSCAD
jgi:hypothetical protein